MRLTNKQALVLYDIAQWACQIAGGVGGYSHETIQAVVNSIINQQSDEVRELGEGAQNSAHSEDTTASQQLGEGKTARQ